MKKQAPKILVTRSLTKTSLKLLARNYYFIEGGWLLLLPCGLLVIVGWILAFIFPTAYWCIIPWGLTVVYFCLFLVAAAHMATEKVKIMWNKPQPVDFDEEMKAK